MTAKALKALKASIAHWRRLTSGKLRKGEELGPEWCALCRAFQYSELGNCKGCPVSAATGHAFCHGTPYAKAAEASWDCYSLDSRRFKAAAAKELAFLESLLPKGKAKP